MNSDIPIPPSNFFPPAEEASDDGLLGVGGELSPDMIIDAIVHGIFPWTINLGDEDGNLFDDEVMEDSDEIEFVDDESEDSNNEEEITESSMSTGEAEKGGLGGVEYLSDRCRNASWNSNNLHSLTSLDRSGEVLGWWSPDPRAIFDLDNLHIPKRLIRTMRSRKFHVTFDQAFPEVMLACATVGERKSEGSWITREFYAGYCKLFEIGFAHSVECWIVDPDQDKSTSEFYFNRDKARLVGGVYGVAINGFFDGESMFSTERDASKVALFSLLLRLKDKGFKLFDIQILNEHTASLGGIEIPRKEYLDRLAKAVTTQVKF